MLVRDDEVGGGDGREQEPGERDGQEASHHLGDDEPRRGDGRDPRKVLLSVRPTVTAGLAKLVEDVNQYAAAM